MKRIFRNILMLSLVFSVLFAAVSCGGGIFPPGTSSDGDGKGDTPTLYERGLALIQSMDELVESEKYMALYTLSANLLDDIETIRRQKFDSPTEVYQIRLNDPMAFLGMDQTGSISENVKDKLEASAYASIATRLNSVSGNDAVMLGSICTDSTSFLCDGVEEHTVYLYRYEYGNDVIVSFRVGEDGTVFATAHVLFTPYSTASKYEGAIAKWATMEKIQ